MKYCHTSKDSILIEYHVPEETDCDSNLRKIVFYEIQNATKIALIEIMYMVSSNGKNPFEKKSKITVYNDTISCEEILEEYEYEDLTECVIDALVSCSNSLKTINIFFNAFNELAEKNPSSNLRKINIDIESYELQNNCEQQLIHLNTHEYSVFYNKQELKTCENIYSDEIYDSIIEIKTIYTFNKKHSKTRAIEFYKSNSEIPFLQVVWNPNIDLKEATITVTNKYFQKSYCTLGYCNGFKNMTDCVREALLTCTQYDDTDILINAFNKLKEAYPSEELNTITTLEYYEDYGD